MLLTRNFSMVVKVAVSIIAILVLYLASSPLYAQNQSKDSTIKYKEGPTLQPLEIADPVNSRSGLMAFIRPLDSDFVFKQGANVDGLEEFSATDRYNTSVEIIGSENDIKTVKWTIRFTANRDVNIKETFRLANFLDIVAGSEAVDWLSNQHKNNLAAHPLDDYTETKEFGSRKIKFDYLPRLRYTSMTVFMKK
jgi:hypothetical protein